MSAALDSVPSMIDRIRHDLVGLKMPRALEALDHIVRRLEHGELSALEADRYSPFRRADRALVDQHVGRLDADADDPRDEAYHRVQAARRRSRGGRQPRFDGCQPTHPQRRLYATVLAALAARPISSSASCSTG